jgi:regulator of cell morphogenesis and NO signaling
MSSALIDLSLADLASSLQGAADVLAKYNLDFSCNGHRRLRDEAVLRGLDAAAIAAQIEQASVRPASEPAWRYRSPDELVEHILGQLHARHLRLLPQLIDQACRIEHSYADWPECPHGLALQLWNLQQDLHRHLQQEKQLLPLLLSANPGATPIAAMRIEHQEYATALQDLARLSNDFNPPARACNTWIALYLGLWELRRDLMQHMHLENNLLFTAPRANQYAANPVDSSSGNQS